MKDQHKDVFRAIIWSLAEEFGRKGTEAMITTYWAALNGLEWEAFERAVDRIRRDSQSFPRPIDILRQADDGPQESEAEKAAREDRDRIGREIEDWAKDRTRVAVDADRFRLLVEHSKGEHRAAFDAVCDSCQFDRSHPSPHLHLRAGLVAGDINWRLLVEGCCAGRDAR